MVPTLPPAHFNEYELIPKTSHYSFAASSSKLDALQQRLEAHLGLALLEGGGFGELAVPDLTWWTAREAVLNGLVHRDYFLSQSVYVELHPGRVGVSSPGGFIGGVRPEADVRRMCGYSRAEVVRLMRALRERGLARVEGRGRGAYYAPGPKLQQTVPRGNPRRDP